MTNKMCVVKKYHTLINNEAGYADIVRVGFLPFRSISSLAFERKLNTGCGKASQIAFPNRQGVALPIFGLASNLKDTSHKRVSKREPATGDKHSAGARCGLSVWGFVQGGYPLYVY